MFSRNSTALKVYLLFIKYRGYKNDSDKTICKDTVKPSCDIIQYTLQEK